MSVVSMLISEAKHMTTGGVQVLASVVRVG
jgi:hypothetical protein